jgi:hypothetical protein
MSDQYDFAADGTFREYVYIYTQSYGCRTQVWVEMQGRVQFDATTFTKRVTAGRFKTSDTCAASRNFDRAMTRRRRASARRAPRTQSAWTARARPTWRSSTAGTTARSDRRAARHLPRAGAAASAATYAASVVPPRSGARGRSYAPSHVISVIRA